MASAESLWRKKSLSFPFWTLIIAACESSPVSSPTCVYAKSLQSCPTLCNPVDCSSPGSSVQRFSRQEYWSGLPCPPAGVSSWPRDGTYISRLLHWQVGSLPLVPPWKPKRAGFLTLFNWSSVLFFFFLTIQSLHSYMAAIIELMVTAFLGDTWLSSLPQRNLADLSHL